MMAATISVNVLMAGLVTTSVILCKLPLKVVKGANFDITTITRASCSFVLN